MRRLALLFIVLLLFAGTGAGKPLTPGDFYGGYYLETPEGFALYRLDLPFALYGKVSSANGADIRVFNGGGELVPHFIRPLVRPEPEKEAKNIPVFPLYGNGAAMQTSTPDLSVRVKRDSGGTIVQMDAGAAGAKKKIIAGYLLDISAIRAPLAEIELNWSGGEGGLGAVTVDQSDDLQYWRRVATQVAIADLRFGTEKVVKKTVALPPVTATYLRLSWGETNFPFTIMSVTARLSHSFDIRELHWYPLPVQSAETRKGRPVIEFHSSFHLPVCAANFTFGQPNSAARIELSSRASDHDNWQLRCTGSFYQLLMNPGTLENDPCLLPATADPFWRAEILDDGSGIGGDGMKTLQLRLGHRSEELVFVARGPKPFLLAYGSGALAAASAPPATDGLPGESLGDGKKALTGLAILGRAVVFGGEAALQPRIAASTWKKMILWAVIAGGVIILAQMVRTLLREMKKRESPPSP